MKTCWLQVLTINTAGISEFVLALKKLEGLTFIKVTDPEVGLPHSHMTWERTLHHDLSNLGGTMIAAPAQCQTLLL